MVNYEVILEPCPLCEAKNNSSSEFVPIEYCADQKRSYLQCENCRLVYVPKEFYLSSTAEKTEYDLHQNNPNDLGYRKFLSRLVEPLLEKLQESEPVYKNVEGLDFGCGPGPAIQAMMGDAGYRVANYDLYYANNKELLKRRYNFIILTEVIEHIAKPAHLLDALNDMLTVDSILAVMTKRVTSLEGFKKWHYKNDPTHICFYSVETFQWIANHYNWQLDVIDDDVVFFYNKGDSIKFV